MSTEPIYRSQPTKKSLWREYRLFADRIELDSIPWGTVRVPLSDVKAVSVRPPMVIFDLFRGDYGLGELLRAPKLDLADMHEHVALEKTGFWKQFRFTPDDPEAFCAAVEEALAAHKGRAAP
ncbi:MAG: hypothetical protein JNL28_03805 [Planctomycetes bacterium]|nr:hypothetical protein [Planctomycetota bacterium]